MQAEVENLGGLSRKLKVKVPHEDIQNEANKRIKELTKEVKIQGFRPGKVPESVVRTRYGSSVHHEAVQDAIWKTLQEALTKQNIYPAGTPHIEIINMKEGEPLEYVASFEIYPEVNLVDIENITIEKPEVSIKEEHIDDVIEKLRKQNVKWQEVDRASKEGDLLEIDFEGYVDNEPFAGGTAKNFALELGSKRMIPGFEDPLYNVKADANVDVQVTFPKDYHAKDLADKPALFKVKVHKVKEPKLPELNDDFAKDLGVTKQTIEGLKEEVRKNLERELQYRIRNDVKNQIINKLLEKNEIEVPKTLVEDEIKRLQQQMKQQWSMQTGQKNAPELPKEQFEQQARKNVTLGLLLSQCVQDNKIKVDGVKVREKIEEVASGYHRPEEIINMYYNNKDALKDLEAAVLEDQAIDKILEQVKVTPKPVTYEDIMNPAAERGEE